MRRLLFPIRVHGAACACCVRRRGALRSGACRNAPIPHATEAQGGAAATAIRPGVRSARAQGSRQLRASSAPAQGRLRVLEDVDMLSRRVFLVLACFAAAVCAWPAEAPAQSKLKVVASFSILGDLVHQIGGDRVEVTTLVGPNGDAHAYSPTPADSAKIQQADLVAINGISFEMWADRLVKAASYKGARLVASRGIRALRAGGRPDPHAWQDVQNVKLYVANIRDALICIDPAGAADYQARATAYLAELDELDAEIKKAFEAIPKARRKAITSHDAFTYFGDAYGVVFHSPQGISTDAAASSRRAAALIEQIKAEGIRRQDRRHALLRRALLRSPGRHLHRPHAPQHAAARGGDAVRSSADQRLQAAHGHLGQHDAGEARILVHAGDERLGAREALLGADPVHELDVQTAAIEVAGEVEQVDLEQRRTIVEGRAAAEARDAAIDLARCDGGPDRVDAVPQPALVGEADVGGRKA